MLRSVANLARSGAPEIADCNVQRTGLGRVGVGCRDLEARHGAREGSRREIGELLTPHRMDYPPYWEDSA